jgi:hypothetical protein
VSLLASSLGWDWDCIPLFSGTETGDQHAIDQFSDVQLAISCLSNRKFAIGHFWDFAKDNQSYCWDPRLVCSLFYNPDSWAQDHKIETGDQSWISRSRLVGLLVLWTWSGVLFDVIRTSVFWGDLHAFIYLWPNSVPAQASGLIYIYQSKLKLI